MEPLEWAGLASGAAGALASITGAQNANAAASAQMGDQQRFQAQMSNTAHTREVADLKNAGLNPILSANAGASSPLGAQAPVMNTMSGVGDNLTKGISTALQAQQTESQTKLNTATALKTGADADLSRAGIKKINAEGEVYDLIKEGINTGAKGWKALKGLTMPSYDSKSSIVPGKTLRDVNQRRLNDLPMNRMD